jgi:hypothetical protein
MRHWFCPRILRWVAYQPLRTQRIPWTHAGRLFVTSEATCIPVTLLPEPSVTCGALTTPGGHRRAVFVPRDGRQPRRVDEHDRPFEFRVRGPEGGAGALGHRVCLREVGLGVLVVGRYRSGRARREGEGSSVGGAASGPLVSEGLKQRHDRSGPRATDQLPGPLERRDGPTKDGSQGVDRASTGPFLED